MAATTIFQSDHHCNQVSNAEEKTKFAMTSCVHRADFPEKVQEVSTTSHHVSHDAHYVDMYYVECLANTA